MRIVNKVKIFILNHSIKTNLLSLYSIIVIVMSILLLIMLAFSIQLNSTYNKIMLNIENYNKIYYQVNNIDKDIFFNITEQKTFEKEYYTQTINDISDELIEIGSNFDGNERKKSVASVEILRRTIKTLSKYIDETDMLIKNNASYTARRDLLTLITHTKEIIGNNVQELMEFNLTQSQKNINFIKSNYNIALCLIIFLFLISIIASVSFLLFVIKDTVNKINTVSRHANRLANGDLAIEHIDFGDSNEFQVLAQSFNQMKKNIKEYISQLSSSEMRISSILTALNDGIVITNSWGMIESCNDAITKIFNYKKEDVIGKNIHEIINAIDFSRYKYDRFNAQELVKDIKIIDNKYQLEGITQNDSKVPIEVSYNEIEIEGKRATTFIIYDITQHKNVEKMKDEFIAIVSHELRTPLTSIKGALGLVNAGVIGNIPDKASEILKIANKNCSRLSNIINDILDLEKIKAGKMELKIKEYDVVPIVAEAVEASLDYAKQYNVEYRITNLIDSAIVNIDKNRLIQVLFNLLSNAAKFSHPNSIVNIEVTKMDSQLIRISIKDTGIGIADEFKPQIYDNFSQADSSDSRQKGGTGLGLCITKEILTMLGAAISFESKLNEGTTFFVDLPSA